MIKSDWFTEKWKVVLLALSACLLWGSAFPAIKISYSILNITDTFSMIQLAGIRFFIAGILLLLFIGFVLKIPVLPAKNEWPVIVLIALLQVFGAYIFFYIGMSNTASLKASILSSTEIFILVLVCPIFFQDDRMNVRKLMGLVLGTAGIVITNIMDGGEFTWSFYLQGEGFLFLNALLQSISFIIFKKKSSGLNSFRVNAWEFLIGGVFLMIFSFLGNPRLLSFTGGSLLLLLHLAFLSAAGFSIWYTLIKYNHVSKIIFFEFTVPIFGSLISVLSIPGETFTGAIALGLLLVAAGIVITYLPSKNQLQ